jgi:hypothetical protein
MVRMTRKDWPLFAEDRLKGELRHGKLLKPESCQLLHTVVSKETSDALGWGVKRDQAGAVETLAHTGSNGFWPSEARTHPQRRVIYLVVINAGPPGAGAAAKALGDNLDEWFSTAK